MLDFPLSQIPEILTEWLPSAASIAIANRSKYVLYRRGTHDLCITPGDSVRPGSIAHRVFSTADRVESDIDESVFGIAYHGLGYPFRSANGIQSALAIILPLREPKIQDAPKFIMGQVQSMWRPVPVEDIVYFESNQKKTWFFTQTGSYTTNSTLQSLEGRLPHNQFLRIHRSYIINISHMDCLLRDDDSKMQVILNNQDKTRLQVSQTYVKSVRDSLGF